MEDSVRTGLCKVSWRINAAPDSTEIPPARFSGKRANYVWLIRTAWRLLVSLESPLKGSREEREVESTRRKTLEVG